jgi:hypothetical protein
MDPSRTASFRSGMVSPSSPQLWGAPTPTLMVIHTLGLPAHAVDAFGDLKAIPQGKRSTRSPRGRRGAATGGRDDGSITAEWMDFRRGTKQGAVRITCRPAGCCEGVAVRPADDAPHHARSRRVVQRTDTQRNAQRRLRGWTGSTSSCSSAYRASQQQRGASVRRLLPAQRCM